MFSLMRVAVVSLHSNGRVTKIKVISQDLGKQSPPAKESPPFPLAEGTRGFMDAHLDIESHDLQIPLVSTGVPVRHSKVQANFFHPQASHFSLKGLPPTPVILLPRANNPACLLSFLCLGLFLITLGIFSLLLTIKSLISTIPLIGHLSHLFTACSHTPPSPKTQVLFPECI